MGYTYCGGDQSNKGRGDFLLRLTMPLHNQLRKQLRNYATMLTEQEQTSNVSEDGVLIRLTVIKGALAKISDVGKKDERRHIP